MRLPLRIVLGTALALSFAPLPAESYSSFEVTVAAHAHGVYWAHRDNQLCASDDGEAFSPVFTYPEAPYSVTAFPEGVAVAAGSRIHLWSVREKAPAGEADLGVEGAMVEWNANARRLVATLGPHVWIADETSRHWTRATVDGDKDPSVQRLHQDGGTWLAEGTVIRSLPDGSRPSQPSLWFSPEGRTWSVVALPEMPEAATSKGLVHSAGQWLFGVIEDQGEVDGVAQVTLRLWTSTDGRKWLREESPGTPEQPWLTEFASGPAGIILVSGTQLWLRAPGGRWSALPPLSSPGGRFLGGGREAYWLASGDFVRRSRDGRTWQEFGLQSGWWIMQAVLGEGSGDDPIVFASRQDSVERKVARLSTFVQP